jgi:hypothetical protein
MVPSGLGECECYVEKQWSLMAGGGFTFKTIGVGDIFSL